jgi:hypothetical protein
VTRERVYLTLGGFGSAFEGFGSAFEGFGSAFEGFGSAFEGSGSPFEGFHNPTQVFGTYSGAPELTFDALLDASDLTLASSLDAPFASRPFFACDPLFLLEGFYCPPGGFECPPGGFEAYSPGFECPPGGFEASSPGFDSLCRVQVLPYALDFLITLGTKVSI